jgi:hypothetical protein
MFASLWIDETMWKFGDFRATAEPIRVKMLYGCNCYAISAGARPWERRRFPEIGPLQAIPRRAGHSAVPVPDRSLVAAGVNL